jgi:restriction system protein
MSWFSRPPSKTLPADDQALLERLRSMRWPEFEALMAAAFERRGYAVEKTGKGGLEGDIDLVLRKDARTELVQCKAWKTPRVGIATVREMHGVRRHREADAVWIASIGAFTDEAVGFAHGQPIELLDRERLVELVRGVKAPVAGDRSEPAATATAASPASVSCPRCGAAMYQRFSLQTNGMYWGCVNYPRCKGSRPLA